MIDITLTDVSGSGSFTTLANNINNNSDTITTALEDALNVTGDVMAGKLDMNGFPILNLPEPSSNASPLRLADLSKFIGGGTISNIPTGGTTGQSLQKKSNTDYDTKWGNNVNSVGLSLPADFTVTNTPVTGTGVLTGTWTNTPTGTGGVVRASAPVITNANLVGPSLTSGILGGTTLFGGSTSGTTGLVANATASGTLTLPTATDTLVGKATTDTLTNKTLTSPVITGGTVGASTLTVSGTAIHTSNSANALIVGPNGATNPTLEVDASTASAATGLLVKSAAAGGGLALSTLSSNTNEPLTINAKGASGLLVGNVSSGGVGLAGGGGGVTVNGAMTYGGVTLNATTTGTGNLVAGTAPTLTSLNSVGVTNGSNAATGSVGEYLSTVVTSGSPVSMTTSGTVYNIASLALTAGDWDIRAMASLLPANTTSVTQLFASISTTSATLNTVPGQISGYFSNATVFNGSTIITQSIPDYRISITTPTTYYLVMQSTFTVSTCSGYGIISARRIR